MNYKVQPHSEEAEKALLGSVLLGGSEVFEKCKHWIRQSEAFYSDDNKKIWIAMHRLFRDKDGIDCVTVIDNYADKLGLDDKNIFNCPVTIIDPKYEDSDNRLITTIFNPYEGAEFLKYKRDKWKLKGKEV